MAIKIVTDSTSYLPPQLITQYQIAVVSLSVSFGTESYCETELDNATFYDRMARSPVTPFSSQPTLADFCQVFTEQVKHGDQVVGVFISEAMSGTYAAALLAKKMVLEEYPTAQIEVVDSRSNCMELGFAVLAGAKAAQAGEALPEVLAQIQRVMQHSRFIFTPEVLDYLRKGGRIGGAAALIGSLLQIKPILTVVDGKTAVLEKVRTKGRAIEEMIRICLADIKAKGLGELVVQHINNELEAGKIAAVLKEKLGIEVPLCPIGPVIGLHVGPGTVALAYYTAI